MKIQEVIVVEGKSDTQRIQSVVDADTIETRGSAIDEETLALIEKSHRQRGVIVFTDPDYPGEKIRKTIMARIPDAKHAFIEQADAQSPKKGSLGVEHASDRVIIQALEAAHVSQLTHFQKSDIDMPFLREQGLINGPGAKIRRQLLGQELHIGYTNGKQLKKRLDMFDLNQEDVLQALKQINKKEMNEWNKL